MAKTPAHASTVPATGSPKKNRLSGPSALILLGPATLFLFVWMIVPLVMTVYYSLERYNLLNPMMRGFVGLRNYRSLLSEPAFWQVMQNTLVLVGACLIITVVFGLALALLYNQDFPGRGVARTLAISPFFVMPVVTALIWRNMLMHPVYGLFSFINRSFGLAPVDYLANYPMESIIVMVSWMWIPFALLVLLTGLQSLPKEQLEAAKLDGAGAWAEFRYVVLPYLSRPISVVTLLQSIFFLVIFAKIFATTGGGPGNATTTLPYLIYNAAFRELNIGRASAGAVFAIILANIFATFLLRFISNNLREEAA